MKKLFFTLLCSLTFIFTVKAQEKGPERWESVIQNFKLADEKNPPAHGANLFVGSSSIALWKDIADYFPGYTVINRGFGGSTYEDLLFYAECVIIPYKPAKVFIYEGDNDIAEGHALKDIMKRVKKIRKIIKKQLPDAEVVIIAAKPSIKRWELADQYIALNQRLKDFASGSKKTEFVDVWSSMLDENGIVLQDIFNSDNLHMNANGYKIWQEVLLSHLVK